VTTSPDPNRVAPDCVVPARVDPDRLADALVRDDGLFRGVEVVAATGSTNADLAEVARRGTTGRVLVAAHQTAGRGRRGRGWAATPGTSQAISVLWHPERTDHWSWLPLVTGVAVCDTARAWGVPAALKWPNDVLVPATDPTGPGHKLAGLLAERVDTVHGAACVLGIGLNTTAGRDDLPVPTATSLALAGAARPLDVTAVIADLLGRLERLLLWWRSGEQDDLLADLYANRCGTLGRRVRADLGDGHLVGEAVRVDDGGALVLLVDGTERSVVAGDVVHLR